MDEFRGSGVGVFVQCEKGHVLVPNYSRAKPTIGKASR